MSGREGVGSGEGTLSLKWKVEEVDEEVVVADLGYSRLGIFEGG